MDVPTLFISAILSNFWWFIPLAIFGAFLKSPWFKGKLGEWLVNTKFLASLDKQTYHLIKDVTLPTEDGTTQIDHILVSRFGIFVVETKNMKGWIFGSEKQKIWTQQIYKQRHKFQNPLRQNYKHVKTLEALLNIEANKIFSLVLFVGDCEFKTEMPANVAYLGSGVRFIESHTDVLFSDEELQQIIGQIEKQKFERGFKTDRAHVRNLKQRHAAQTFLLKSAPIKSISSTNISTTSSTTKSVHTKIDTAINEKKQCPKCGSEMVEREAKNGKNIGKPFWGCSRFPKCRGIVRI